MTFDNFGDATGQLSHLGELAWVWADADVRADGQAQGYRVEFQAHPKDHPGFFQAVDAFSDCR